MTAPDIAAKIAAARALEAARPGAMRTLENAGFMDNYTDAARARDASAKADDFARNHHAALWDVVEAAKNHLDYYVVDGANTFDALRAALAKLAEAP